MAESVEFPSRLKQLQGDQMQTPDEVAAMLRLKAVGWGFGGSPERVDAAM